MESLSIPDCKTKWFRWGIALTCFLSLPFIIGVLNAFKGLPEQKATGLGAIAGSLMEIYATLGLILAFVLPVGAIVLLIRSFSRGHPLRTSFSVLCIGWSALTLAVAGVVAWLTFIYLPYRTR